MAESNVEHHRGRGWRRPEQVEELFAAHAGELEAVTLPSGCLADLNAVQAAKPELATLTAAEHHEALAQCTSPRDAQ